LFKNLQSCWWIFKSYVNLRCVSKRTVFSQINPIPFLILQPTTR
jgi:hypothetical protein